METLTAIGNKRIYNQIKKIKKFKITEKDILYREGILEVLENNNKIRLIIISEKIPGETAFENLINKIKKVNNKIKIIFILENQNTNLEYVLNEKKIKYFFSNKFEESNFSSAVIDKSFQNENKELVKILIVSDINFYQFKKIKSMMKNEKNRIDYLSINNLNRRITQYNNFLFIIIINLEELSEIKKNIKTILENYNINSKKIKLLFIENKKNQCETLLLKNIFKGYKVIGKIKYQKGNFVISKRVLKEIDKFK